MLTIARRDFIATVFTPVFLLFLFAPALIGGMSTIGGLGAASMADGAADRARLVVIAPPPLAAILSREDARLRKLFRHDERPSTLSIVAPQPDPAAQARALMGEQGRDTDAVLYGPIDRPSILVPARSRLTGNYLEALAQATVSAGRPDAVVVSATRIAAPRPAVSLGGQHQSGFLAVFGIFFLTLFLAGQVVGTMAEERNNKVIEVLAAAVPLEAVFGGKLIGMFGVAVLFVAFWGTVLGQVAALIPPAIAADLGTLTPAVGGPAFAILFAAYFSMAYLLLGSVFLGIGAQASTMREIQMLSLPITLVQVGMFALASAAARLPNSLLARVAEIFPLSSPFAMAGRAANSPEIWPHLLALGWQALWVALFITVGARLFRRGVLQSGGGRPFWRRRPRDPISAA
ncbi:hypothetical protein GCM10011380_03300 [Sphingomonas metalli]|uniref:ABC-2 type transporter transmembrane domain-containing protein n=2 Tax=Sphingomonas metalli TaxID=1779358 RepID=A0A916SUX8_9SPHN|nr:hypothetical protein GCM10011380_03300 [Sphingomonas metalli]